MLEYDRIDVSEGIDVSKSSKSKIIIKETKKQY